MQATSVHIPKVITQLKHIQAFVFGLIGFMVSMLFNIHFYSQLAIGVFLYSLALLILLLGDSIPIKASLFFLAALQWLFGPVLDYAGLSNHYKYYMYVPEEVYMPFALSGVLALGLGLWLIDNKKQHYLRTHYLEKIILQVQYYPQLSYYLIGFGIFTSITIAYIPPALRFVFYLLSNLKYIGVIYLMFSTDKRKWWILALVIFFTFTSSLNSAMFHGLLLWIMFLGMYFLIVNTYHLRRKILLIFIGFLFVFTIQVVKHEFRQYVWFGGFGGSKIQLYVELIEKNLFSDEAEEDEYLSSTRMESIVVRINQGWIISRIMDYIPNYNSFIGGQTINEAVMASLVPRFLNPNKAMAGGKEWFARFTGYELGKTSMGPSLLGEGYGNYGKTGAVIFVFIMGLVFGLAINIIYNLAIKYPTLILWLPLLFFQVVKAESDLVRVLNHLTKSGIIIALLYWGARMFGIRL